MRRKANDELIVIKYGGNAMSDHTLRQAVIRVICQWKNEGKRIVLVHGGGPFIRKALEEAGIESEFIDGQRKTTPEALERVEMALKGLVNGQLVRLINAEGHLAVGLSGKDGQIVTARKRLHLQRHNGTERTVDLGRVGDVASVDTTLLRMLLDNGYLPVLTCLASDEHGIDYNINGDLFAGHIAGALHADQYLVLTDVDGLMSDPPDRKSLLSAVNMKEAGILREKAIVAGGMIPKIDSCRIALEKGAASARIINGTRPEQWASAEPGASAGTAVTL